MVQTATFWNKVAARYAKSPVKNEEAYQKKLAITRDYFRPDSEVLELACGTGSTAIAHAPYVAHILALDISEKMLDIAQKKIDAANIHNISLKQTAIEEFDSPEACYDLIMAHSILHLLENPEAALQRIYRLLKPGGVLVSSTVCLGDASIIFRLVLPLARLFRFAPYVNVLTDKQLQQYFINAGFHIDYHWTPGKNQGSFIVAKKPL